MRINPRSPRCGSSFSKSHNVLFSVLLFLKGSSFSVTIIAQTSSLIQFLPLSVDHYPFLHTHVSCLITEHISSTRPLLLAVCAKKNSPRTQYLYHTLPLNSLVHISIQSYHHLFIYLFGVIPAQFGTDCRLSWPFIVILKKKCRSSYPPAVLV